MKDAFEVATEVMEKRDYQRQQWGDVHDNEHTLAEWRALIDHYAKQGKWVDVAALGIAAAEAFERNAAMEADDAGK